MPSTSYGKIFFVGAGPGDPGLLTLRGKACLEQAQAVLYDGLVNPRILEFASQAEHVYVGKKSGSHSLPQQEINRILIDYASRHDRIVRLKGGDPFVFGRGGEEASALHAAGVPFEIVPGVTAGIGAPAYAGIPVTCRGISSAVSFFTAHGLADEGQERMDLARLATHGTLVFYMTTKTLPQVVQAALLAGRAPDTPAAAIEWGTYARQRTVEGSLENIAQRCIDACIEAPVLFVIGDVVALRDHVAWFEARPLHALRIVTTHAAERQGVLEARLAELGAEVFCFPSMEASPQPPPPAFEEISRYDWIVLASVNAAEMLFSALEQRGQDARTLAGVRLCTIGETAHEAVQRRFLAVDAPVDNYGDNHVIAAIEAHGPLHGQRVLLPRSDVARGSLSTALRDAGATVDETAAYRSTAPATTPERVTALLNFAPNLVVFTNAGAVRNFSRLLGEESFDTLKTHAAFASIGPVTSQAAQDHGLKIAIEPARHDIPHLIEAICAWRDAAPPI